MKSNCTPQRPARRASTSRNAWGTRAAWRASNRPRQPGQHRDVIAIIRERNLPPTVPVLLFDQPHQPAIAAVVRAHIQVAHLPRRQAGQARPRRGVGRRVRQPGALARVLEDVARRHGLGFTREPARGVHRAPRATLHLIR